MVEDDLNKQKSNFTTKLLLRGILISQTRRLDEIYKTAMSTASEEGDKRKKLLECTLLETLLHGKKLVINEQEIMRETLDYQKRVWTEEMR